MKPSTASHAALLFAIAAAVTGALSAYVVVITEPYTSGRTAGLALLALTFALVCCSGWIAGGRARP